MDHKHTYAEHVADSKESDKDALMAQVAELDVRLAIEQAQNKSLVAQIALLEMQLKSARGAESASAISSPSSTSNLSEPPDSSRHTLDAQVLIADALKAHIGLLMEDLEQGETKRASLEATVDTLKLELNSTVSQFEVASAKLKSAENDLRAAQRLSQSAAAELTVMRSEIQTSKDNQAHNKAIIESLKQHVHLLMNDVDISKADVETEKANHAALWRIIDQLQIDLDLAKAEQDQAKVLNKEMKQVSSQLEGALRQRSAESEDLFVELQTAREDMSSLQARVREVEAALALQNQNAIETRATIARLQGEKANQGEQNSLALAKKDKQIIDVITASSQRTARLAGQIDTLVKGLAQERHFYFQRKSENLQRKAALLVASGILNTDWYLSKNDDVAKSGIDPGIHYLTTGVIEGRSGAE